MSVTHYKRAQKLLVQVTRAMTMLRLGRAECWMHFALAPQFLSSAFAVAELTGLVAVSTSVAHLRLLCIFLPLSPSRQTCTLAVCSASPTLRERLQLRRKRQQAIHAAAAPARPMATQARLSAAVAGEAAVSVRPDWTRSRRAAWDAASRC